MGVLDLLGEQLEATSRFNFELRVATIQAGSTEKVRLRNPTTGIHPRARDVFHGTSWNRAAGISATRTIRASEKALRDHPGRHPRPLEYVTLDYGTAI